MKQQHHLVYVPGIRDDIFHVQGILVKFWRIYGVYGHCHPMPWAGDGAYDSKFNNLLGVIDKHLSRGHRVSLIGASAGASAVINAYSERRGKVQGLALICAKLNNPETVSDRTYRENPAFKASMIKLQNNLHNLTATDKSKMKSYYSVSDNVVPYSATTYPGISEVKLPRLRHGQSIIYGLSIGSRKIIKSL